MYNDQDIPSLQDRRMAARLVRSSTKCRGDSDGNIFRRFPKTAKGVSTQLQSSGLVAHENSTFRNLALAVSGPFMA